MQTKDLFLKGEFVGTLVVDDDDAHLLDLKWHAQRGHRVVYAKRKEDGHVVFIHRVIMQPPDGMTVDHINHDGLDNRRCNLRVCTLAQNLKNKRAAGASPYLGVSWDKSHERWRAQIDSGNGPTTLGRFESEIEAARCYDEYARIYHGEFANVNFPFVSPKGVIQSAD